MINLYSRVINASVYLSFFFSSDDPAFLEGLFVAKDTKVSTFTEAIQKFRETMTYIADPIGFILFMFVVYVIETWKRKMWGFPVDSGKEEFKEGFQIG